MKTKRLISAIMVLVMVLSMALPAFAEGDEPTGYNVKTMKAKYGEVLSSPANPVAPGTEVTLTVVPKPGAHVTSLKVDGVAIALDQIDENNQYTFIMPEHNVEVEAGFVFDGFELIKTITGQGTITATPEQEYYARGDHPAINIQAAEGWTLTSLTVDGSAVELPIPAKFAVNFTDHSIEIVAVFEEDAPTPTHTIEIEYDTNEIFSTVLDEPWYVTATTGVAKAGDEVSLTVTAAPGYKILRTRVYAKGSTIGSGWNALPNEDGTVFTFTMPDYDVMVAFITEPGEAYTVELEYDHEIVEADLGDPWGIYGCAEAGDVVSFQYGVQSGYQIAAVMVVPKDEGSTAEPFEADPEGPSRYHFTMPAYNVVIKILTEPVPNAYAYYVGSTGSFNDSIKLNFYVNYKDNGEIVPMPDGTKAVLTYKVGNTVATETIAITESMKTSNGYKISHNLVAKQIEDVVNLKLVDGNDDPMAFLSSDGQADYTTLGYDNSLLLYLDRVVVSSTTSAEMKALAVAAKDYCYAAAQQFNYNWNGQYAFTAAVGNVTAATLVDYTTVESGDYPEGVSHKGYTVMFETDNSFRKYLNFDSSIEDPANAFTYTVDSTTGPQLLMNYGEGQGHGYCLTFTKVYSNKLHKAHTIQISDGTDTYTLTASVLSYCKLILESETASANMKTLARAAYLYNQAAIAKFGE